MRSRSAIWNILLLTFIVMSGCKTPGTNKSSSGYTSIFDGKTLKGWDGDPTYWRVENGCLVGEVTPSTLLKRNTFIIWRGGTVKDFELKVQYRISDRGNSGINYRSTEIPNMPYLLRGYQADVDGQNNYSGSNYEERARTMLAVRGEQVIIPPGPTDTAGQYSRLSKQNRWTPAQVTGSLGSKDSLATFIKKNDWNEYHLVVKGNHLQHYINGVLMSDVIDNDIMNRKMEGLLGVQVHTGPPMKVEYRDIRIRKIAL